MKNKYEDKYMVLLSSQELIAFGQAVRLALRSYPEKRATYRNMLKQMLSAKSITVEKKTNEPALPEAPPEKKLSK